MASQARLGYLSKFKIASAASPPVLTALSEVTEITPPNTVADDVEVTHMESPGRTREYIAGFIEGGECSVAMNFVPGSASDQRILALKASGEVVPMQIEWPDGSTWSFEAHVKGYEIASPIDDRMIATATMKVDSDTTVADASP